MCFDSTLISGRFENVKVTVPSLGCSSNATKDVVENKPEDQKKEGTLEPTPVQDSKEVAVEVKEPIKNDSGEPLKNDSGEPLKNDSGEPLKNDSVSVSIIEPVQEHGSNQV